MRINKWSSAVVAAALFLTCTVMNNPYNDRSKCGVAITGAKADGDTVAIFSPTQFRVELLLQAHITGFTFTADRNYQWTAADTTVTGERFGDAYAFPFTVAFSDTGWKSVRVTATVDDGTTITDSIGIYCVSPLDQPDIVGQVGQSVLLTTTPVTEPMALYVWKFGPGDSIWSDQPSQTWYINQITAATGKLYVRLFGKTAKSPDRLFKISMADVTPPSVTIQDTNAYGPGRTHVKCGYPPYFFKVMISDGSSSLRQALVDGGVFTQIDTIDTKMWMCIKEFPQLAPAGDSLGVTVTAKDIYDNLSSVKYWLHYDSTIVVRPALVITEPAADSAAVSGRQVTVRGSATDIYGHDTLYVFSDNPGSPGTPQVITPALPAWEWVCALAQNVNTLRFVLAVRSGVSTYDSLDNAVRIVRFDSTVIDSIPPVIDNIFAGGLTVADGFQSGTSPVTLTVRPFDQSRITRVTFNGIAAVNQGDNTWTADVALAHVPQGTLVTVVASDSSGNPGQAARRIYYNRTPRITHMPSLTFATVGIPYADTVRAVDDDGDTLSVSVRISARTGTQVITPGAGGRFTWTPAPGDTGNTDVLVQVSDGYPGTADSTYRIMVGTPVPVVHKARFVTTAADFPDSLPVGQPWQLTLKIDQPSTNGDYVFNAQIVETGEPLMTQTTDSVIRWTPTTQQRGVRTLRLVVRSSADSADSIIPMPQITVYEIQPWVVSFSATTSTASEGVPSHKIPVRLNKPSDGTVSVDYRVNTGLTPMADTADYRLTAAVKRIVFPAGSTVDSIPMTIVNDTLPELTEYVTLALYNPGSSLVQIGSPAQHAVTINSNDTARLFDTVTITTADTFTLEGDWSVPIRIQAKSPLRQEVTFNVIQVFPATYSSDFTLDKTPFTMGRGQSSQTINLSVIDDQVFEPVSEFIVLVLKATIPNVTITDSVFVFAILPSDSAQGGKSVVYLYNNSLPAFEKTVCDTISNMGYGVWPLSIEETKYAYLWWFDALVLSPTTDTYPSIGDSLSDVILPIMCASPRNNRTLGLTSGVAPDTGRIAGSVVEVSTGLIRSWNRRQITEKDAGIPWARPVAGADVVARIPAISSGTGGNLGGPILIDADTGRAVVYYVSPDGGKVPARRSVFPVCTQTNILNPVVYTPEWWTLLKNALNWTATGVSVQR